MQTDHWASQNWQSCSIQEADEEEDDEGGGDKEEEEEEEGGEKEDSGAENSSLQWCDAVLSRKWLPMFSKTVTSPSSDSSDISKICWPALPQDGGTTLYQNCLTRTRSKWQVDPIFSSPYIGNSE